MAGPWEKYGGEQVADDGPWAKYGGDAPKPAQATGPAITRVEKFATGLADIAHGGAQLLTKALPTGVVEAGNAANNWLAEKTGLVAKIPEGGVDQMVRQREQDYQARRVASGEEGFDGWRTGGNFAAGLAIPAFKGAALVGRVAAGAGNGAVGASLAPVVGEGDFWSQKGAQAGVGAAAGGALSLLGSGVARLVSPKASTNPAVKKLMDEGVTPTAGQILGGGAKRTEEALTSVPLLGSFIRNAQQRAAENLNEAAVNRSLKPVGAKLPNGVVGRDAIEYAERELGKRYDTLLPKLTVKADQQFAGEVKNLGQMIRSGAIDPKYGKAFDRFMSTNVLNKFKGQNALTGQTLKDIESDLGQQVSRLGQSTDPDARLLGDAYSEVQDNLRSLLTRSNPQAADQLKKINTGWANFKRVQRAAGSVAAEDGVFSPAQLQGAAKALDRSKDKGAFARGNALMQDLSEPGKGVLGNKLPDSGTAERGLTAGMFLDPRSYVAALTAPLAYSKTGQNALATALTKRPESAKTIAETLRKSAPGLGFLAGQVGANALLN